MHIYVYAQIVYANFCFRDFIMIMVAFAFVCLIIDICHTTHTDFKFVKKIGHNSLSSLGYVCLPKNNLFWEIIL